MREIPVYPVNKNRKTQGLLSFENNHLKNDDIINQKGEHMNNQERQQPATITQEIPASNPQETSKQIIVSPQGRRAVLTPELERMIQDDMEDLNCSREIAISAILDY